MSASAYHWPGKKVRTFLSDLGYEGSVPLFQSHGIDGKDLFMLTDSDMKHELKIVSLHDRKELKREIEKLKEMTTVLVQTTFEDRVIDIQVDNPWAYTFDHLRLDLANIVDAQAKDLVLQDRNGCLWGSGSIVLVLNTDLAQTRSIYALRNDSEFKGQAAETDDEDFDEEKNGVLLEEEGSSGEWEAPES